MANASEDYSAVLVLFSLKQSTEIKANTGRVYFGLIRTKGGGGGKLREPIKRSRPESEEKINRPGEETPTQKHQRKSFDLKKKKNRKAKPDPRSRGC